jgi:hypothetical protein
MLKPVRTLSIQEVADGYCVVTVTLEGSVLEHLLSVSLWSDAHVLLAKGLYVCAHIGSFLLSIRICARQKVSIQLTSCSERGIFLSFMEWIAASEAVAPSSAAARTELVFMMTVLD